MSCGNPHEMPCGEVLERVYGYLDGELADADCAKIRQHLDECGPCLREYGLEEAVKRLVAKHCACDPAPTELRAKVLLRIRELRATIEFAELPSLPDWRKSVAIAPYAADLIAQCDGHARRLSVARFGPASASVPALSCIWLITGVHGERDYAKGGLHMHMSGDVETGRRTLMASGSRRRGARGLSWG